MRKEGWEEILAKELEAAQHRSFKYGEFDCCIWPADVVNAITGVDGGAFFRGRYSDLKSARKALKDFSGGALVETVRALSDEHAWPAISPKFAQRGDIVIIDNDDGHSLAICVGTSCVTPHIDGGLLRAPMSAALYAWRIG